MTENVECQTCGGCGYDRALAPCPDCKVCWEQARIEVPMRSREELIAMLRAKAAADPCYMTGVIWEPGEFIAALDFYLEHGHCRDERPSDGQYIGPKYRIAS